jgi:hypothetical protein
MCCLGPPYGLQSPGNAFAQQPMKAEKEMQGSLQPPASAAINELPCDSMSISERTVLVKLPVITAVEIPPGKAKRKRTNWQPRGCRLRGQ